MSRLMRTFEQFLRLVFERVCVCVSYCGACRNWLNVSGCHTLRQMSGVSIFVSGVRNIALNHAVATFVVSNQPNGQHQANYWAITS